MEEVDETTFWLELLVDAEMVGQERLDALLKESRELLAIFAASQLTAKSHRGRSSS